MRIWVVIDSHIPFVQYGLLQSGCADYTATDIPPDHVWFIE